MFEHRTRTIARTFLQPLTELTMMNIYVFNFKFETFSFKLDTFNFNLDTLYFELEASHITKVSVFH